MPVNRNALLRYHTIDMCLQNRGRRWTWHDILEKVNESLLIDNPKSKGIGKTTLYEDLKNIEYKIFNLEIEKIKDGRKTYLRYADSNSSIRNQPLNEKEAEQIRDALSIISRFRGLPHFDWINELIPILETKMGLAETDKEIISYDSNTDYLGNKHIPILYKAIHKKIPLKLIYQDFKSSIAYEIEISPQYLKQFNSRWFLMSFMEKWGDKPQINALDRIVEIEETDGKYISIKDFDWEDYFSDMVGVSRMGENPIEVKLLIPSEIQASYITTKPLHQSQKKLKKVDGGYEITIFVIPNIELEKLILSFGENIKVIAPESLVETIKSRVNKMNITYQS